MVDKLQPDSRGIEPQGATPLAPESVVFQASKPYVSHLKASHECSDACLPQGTVDKPFVPTDNDLAYVLRISPTEDRFADSDLP